RDNSCKRPARQRRTTKRESPARIYQGAGARQSMGRIRARLLPYLRARRAKGLAGRRRRRASVQSGEFLRRAQEKPEQNARAAPARGRERQFQPSTLPNQKDPAFRCNGTNTE